MITTEFQKRAGLSPEPEGRGGPVGLRAPSGADSLKNVASAPPLAGEWSSKTGDIDAVASIDAPTRESVEIAVVTDLGEIEHDWRHFQETADCTPFQTFEWLISWQRCVGTLQAAHPMVVTFRRQSGELLLILPLAVESVGPLTRLVFLGHDLGDYNAPLLHPLFSSFVPADEFPGLWNKVLQRIRERSDGQHDVIMLDKMPERVGAQHNPLMFLSTRPNPSSAYSTALGPEWEAFYAERRSVATRQRERSKRKKLNQIGPLALIRAEDDDKFETLNRLFEQKRRSLERMGVPDLFAQPGYTSFFIDVAQSAPALVHVSRLAVGESCAAANLGLVFRNCYYYVLTSYADGPISRLGPGTVHLHELMKAAIGGGCTRFDFTIGDEAYKLDWADTKIDLFDHISGASWVGRFASLAIIAKLAAKRTIKQSPRGLKIANFLRARLNSWGARF